MRRSGVLMHITSLDSPGGIGTMGKSAYAFADFLEKAGLTVWQVLPIGPTGYGESPYQSASTFAGNPMLIDLDALVAEGLLDRAPDASPAGAQAVDFDRVREEKRALLRRSFLQSFEKARTEVDAFTREETWLKDYALFMAVKRHFGDRMWSEWPDRSIRMREKDTLQRYARELAPEVDYHRYVQYLFFRQWRRLKAYVNQKGIRLFGDMPIYVAEDSSDTWANPALFQLDEALRPARVAGVPPDYFSADGQRWGNPLYNWKTLRKRKFDWWLQRLAAAGRMFDWLRIDHFIGFANYYSIPAACPTAREGRWEKAPGFALFRRVRRELPGLRIVAEDLGEVGPRVKRLLKKCGYPGMKVLVFGFDSDEGNPHFPGNIVRNSIVYTGTHDNDTALGWWEKADGSVRGLAERHLPGGADIAERLIECAFQSVADTAIVPMQDFLHLGGEARMNYPGTVGGNWLWRMLPGAASDALAREIRLLNRRTHREGTT